MNLKIKKKKKILNTCFQHPPVNTKTGIDNRNQRFLQYRGILKMIPEVSVFLLRTRYKYNRLVSWCMKSKYSSVD